MGDGEKKEKEYKDGYNVGTVIVRNGWNVLNEYHDYHDGLVGVIIRRTGNVICIKYYTPFLSRTGYRIQGDSIFPDNIECTIKREPITGIVRQPITGVKEVLEDLEKMMKEDAPL